MQLGLTAEEMMDLLRRFDANQLKQIAWPKMPELDVPAADSASVFFSLSLGIAVYLVQENNRRIEEQLREYRLLPLH